MTDIYSNLSRTRLGPTDIQVSRIGIGTNRWVFGENDEEVFQAYKALLDNGIDFFDSAEVYTGGRSEPLLGACQRKDGRPSILVSKYWPSGSRRYEKDFTDALDGSLRRLGVDTIDLYYVHNPPLTQSIEDLMDYMAKAWVDEKISTVGVSNFDTYQMSRAIERLETHGLKLAANQVHYSLLHREPELNGVLDACRTYGVSLVAFRPISKGQLTSTGILGKTPLENAIQAIARDREKTATQVALNWLLCRDKLVIPIPGVTKEPHAVENAGAMGWALSSAEFNELDDHSL